MTKHSKGKCNQYWVIFLACLLFITISVPDMLATKKKVILTNKIYDEIPYYMQITNSSAEDNSIGLFVQATEWKKITFEFKDGNTTFPFCKQENW